MKLLPQFRVRLFKRDDDLDIPGAPAAWLCRAADFASWVLIVSLMYFLWLYTLEIAGDRAIPLRLGEAGIWTLNAAFYWPLLIGFTLSAIGLPLLTKIGIPIYCELNYKKPGQGWPKFWMLVLIVLTSFVLIAGNLHIINDARLEKNRAGAVKTEQADMARGALEANLASINQDLADITNPALTTYQAQAAREGAESWAKRVAIAKAQKDYQADAIARAQAAAERGDALRAQRKEAIAALAAAPTKAAAVDRVVKDGDWATGIADEVDKARSLLFSVVQDIAALLMGWIAYRLWQVRSQKIADHEAAQAKEEDGGDLRITDQTQIPQPIPGEVQMFEEPAGSGIMVEKIFVRTGYKEDGVTPHGYWRQLPRKRSKSQEEADAAAAERDNGQRNPADWFVRNASDSRAPVANQVELGDENALETALDVGGEMAQHSAGRLGDDIRDAGNAVDVVDMGGVDSSTSGFDVVRSSDGDLGDRDDPNLVLDRQESIRTAYESSFEGQGQDEVDAQEDQPSALAETSMGDEEGAPASDVPASSGIEADESEPELVEIALDAAPLQTPDEQITWDDESEPSEPQEPEYHDPETAETPLPNGEGVLVKAAE